MDKIELKPYMVYRYRLYLGKIYYMGYLVFSCVMTNVPNKSAKVSSVVQVAGTGADCYQSWNDQQCSFGGNSAKSPNFDNSFDADSFRTTLIGDLKRNGYKVTEVNFSC